MLKNLVSVNVRIVEELTNLSEYEKSEEGFQKYIDSLHELFRRRDEDTKEAIKSAGGYPVFYQLSDRYFETGVDTVQMVTDGYLKLLKSKEVIGDPNGYRNRIAEYFDFERERFAFPSHFAAALQMCLSNPEVL